MHNIDEGKEHTWQKVLRFLKFSESKHHEVPKSLEKFESLGLQGYMILLEGVNTGVAKVSVRFPHPEYFHVPNIKVNIMVLANIIIDPSDVNILLHDTISFRIFQLKEGKLQELNFTNQYYLEIDNESIGTMSYDGTFCHCYTATGINIGRTAVFLRDRNFPNLSVSYIDENIEFPTPKAVLTVTEPRKMTINLLPHYNWITVEGEKHEIAMDLYSADDRKIWIGPYYTFNIDFDKSLFFILDKSSNGSRIYGEAVKSGSTFVTGTFLHLNARAELKIYKELTLTPSTVVIPLRSNIRKQYKMKFKASGGDGNYEWSTKNAQILQISQDGIAETQNKLTDYNTKDNQKQVHLEGELVRNFSINHTTVKVALTRNPKIFRIADVFFAEPIALKIVKYNFETALGDIVRIHIALFAFMNNTYVPFTICESVNFDFEFKNSMFQMEENGNGELAPEACCAINLRSNEIGQSRLKVSYTLPNDLLKDEVILNVFEELSIVDPIENEIILPIGSSRNIIYTNGPQKIYNLETELVKSVKYDKSIIRATEITNQLSESVHALTVLCTKVGETFLTYEIYNTLPNDNVQLYISPLKTKVICAKPRFLNLLVVQKYGSECRSSNRNYMVNFKKNDDIEIEIEVFDHMNKKLMNITSLLIKLEFYKDNEKHKNVMWYREIEEDMIQQVPVPKRDYILCSVGDLKPEFKVKGIITRYDENILNRYNIVAEEPNFGVRKTPDSPLIKPVIENELHFAAVNTTIFPYESISIFLSSSSVKRIPLIQGTHSIDFKLSESGIVNIDYDKKNYELIITPLEVGHVTLELFDRCLLTDSSHLLIYVVKIGAINVFVPDRVQKSSSIEAVVQLIDSNDNVMIIDHSNLDMYKLSSSVLNPVVLDISYIKERGKSDEIKYLIKGVEVGDATIIFTADYGTSKVTSKAKNIQVFPPLRLFPRNSTLVVGSSIQIYHEGGPHSDANIVYSVQNERIAYLESTRIMARKLGKTKITGRCVGVHPQDRDQQLIFSEDTIEVNIVPLDQIHIQTPLTRIKCGAVMPASIWGIPNLSPMILGTIESLRIVWSTNEEHVVTIFGIFQEIGVEYDSRDSISVRIRAMNPGKANIKAVLILSTGTKITTSVEVHVFNPLELEAPGRISVSPLLMAPRTTLQLKASVDDVTYKHGSNNVNGLINVASDGLVKSYGNLGKDYIFINSIDESVRIDIEVKNVYYILTTLQNSDAKLKHIQKKIPKGLKVALKVTLHDNFGNEFLHSVEDSNAIKYDVFHKNRIDVKTETNLTLTMNFFQETNSMIKISLRDSIGVKYAEDYIKIPVVQSPCTFPVQNTFFVGDIVCFESPIASSVYWSSSNENVLTIAENTGIARILSSRFKFGEKVKVTASTRDKSELSHCMKYDIEVHEADEIKFVDENASVNSMAFKQHLIIRSHLETNKTSNLIARNDTLCLDQLQDFFPVQIFSCQLGSLSEIGKAIIKNYKVMPIFDYSAKKYACKVELLKDVSNVLEIIKNNDISIGVKAELLNGNSDLMTYKLLPMVEVVPPVISFIKGSPTVSFHILGTDDALNQTEMKPSHTDIVKLIQTKQEQGKFSYELKLLKQIPLNEEVTINIVSPLTDQQIVVPINMMESRDICSFFPYACVPLRSFFTILGFLTFLFILVVVLCLYIVSRQSTMFISRALKKEELINPEAFAIPPRDHSSPVTSAVYSGTHFSPDSSYHRFLTMSQSSEASELGSISPLIRRAVTARKML